MVIQINQSSGKVILIFASVHCDWEMLIRRLASIKKHVFEIHLACLPESLTECHYVRNEYSRLLSSVKYLNKPWKLMMLYLDTVFVGSC